jgi:3-methyladenine DNA glycosylase AlkD
MAINRQARATAAAARRRLRELADPDVARTAQRFFKTGPGEYSAGDEFIGVRVPVIRRLGRELRGMSIDEITALLHDRWHEARLLALVLLVDTFTRAPANERASIADLYLRNTRWINNWDLVDSSAPSILGAHLLTRSRTVLDRLARSKNLWERRIAIVATQHLIRADKFDDTLRIAELLMYDSHDLIHKAVGWMLREVGDRDRKRLESFLTKHAHEMPRTMLRYAIEKLSSDDRRRFMSAKSEKR